ncbi:HAD family hydrolase [Streptomyces drozdowiczii]|uniref:HAD family hydrolase n=1 Tax=Streptomyces drozdowiczii TaxID=202862 RepID=A0ABY6PSN8_9ACTN|nr:HAD family hydrolase [Streptomyces drozdowiczii]MCX0245225.1 HAD family hydrolase [Streptomyces drozdowiczii]UZK55107.1 HAD family hydrolase [Streptomyces drozdowiczii]
MTPSPLTVGFDLDMTLIDSRPGIKAVYDALVAETGTPIDTDLVVSRLGPPLEDELANWFPAADVPAVANRYRAMYPAYAIEPTLAMPGAREAIEAIRERGGRTMVVTAKYEPNAKLHLAHLGIEPDVIAGNLWAEQKGVALKEHGATVYVGDHIGDIRGAKAANAVPVGVATGPCDAEELRTAGAHTVLASLTELPAWLDAYTERTAR